MHLMTAATPKIIPPERKPSGDFKAPLKEERGEAPTLLKRLKDEILPRTRDKRLGTVLGMMHLEGILSEAEAEAGFCYAEDVGAYERSRGHPQRHSQSPSFEFGRKGADGLDLDALRRMDPDVADKIERSIKRRRKAVQKRYDRAQAYIPLFPILICTLVEEVCCNDRRIHSLHHPMLKKILSNLAEGCYGLSNASEAARRKPISRKVDAVMVASEAVNALEQWFKGRRYTITEFSVIGGTITGYGHDQFGEVHVRDGEIVESHTIETRRTKLMREAIAAQLLKAAEEKKWAEVSKGRKG